MYTLREKNGKKRGREDSSPDSVISKSPSARRITKKRGVEKTPATKIQQFIEQMCPELNNPANLGTHISNYNSSTAYGDVFLKYLLRKYNYEGEVRRRQINIMSQHGVSKGFSHSLIQNEKEIDAIVDDAVDILAKESILGGKGGIIEITIVFNASLTDAHINLLLIKNGKVEHFEPHGVFLSTRSNEAKYQSIYISRALEKISAKIEAYTQGQINVYSLALLHSGNKASDEHSSRRLKVKMQGVNTCSSLGCQRLENAASLIRRPEIEDEGYCTLWALFFIELWFLTKLKMRDIVTIVFQYLGDKTCGLLSTMKNPKLPKTNKALDALLTRYNRGINRRTKAIELNRFMQAAVGMLKREPGATDNGVMDAIFSAGGDGEDSLLTQNIDEYPYVYIQKLREVRNYLEGKQMKMGLEPVPKMQEKMVEDEQIVEIVRPILGNMYLELIRCYARNVERKLKRHIFPKLENVRENPYDFKEFVDEIDKHGDELSPDLVQLTPVSVASTPVSLGELSGFDNISIKK